MAAVALPCDAPNGCKEQCRNFTPSDADHKMCDCGHKKLHHAPAAVAAPAPAPAALTASAVSSCIGRVLTWLPQERAKKKQKATAAASAGSSTTSSEGLWVVSGQAVCVVHPRLMLTATHVCFDGAAKHALRVLYTPPDGAAPQNFSATLIRYSGMMDVSVLLLDTAASPFRPANVVPVSSPLFTRIGESVALACFPLVSDVNAQRAADEKVVVRQSSVLLKTPRLLPGAITGLTRQSTSHKGIARNFQLAECTYTSFAGCSGGGVFSMELAADGATPQLLGVHTAAIFQTGQTQLHIASLVEGEYDGEPLSSAAAEPVSPASTAAPIRASARLKRKAEFEASDSASSSAAAAAGSPHKETGSNTGSTTPEDSPTKKLQLKLADEVQQKSSLAVCIVADTALNQHPAWRPEPLERAADIPATPAASSFAAAASESADLAVGLAKVEEEKMVKHSRPYLFDPSLLYD